MKKKKNELLVESSVTPIKHISTYVQLLYDCSTQSIRRSLDSLLLSEHSPTSFVVLPYDLEDSSGIMQASDEKFGFIESFGLHLINLIQSNFILSTLRKNTNGLAISQTYLSELEEVNCKIRSELKHLESLEMKAKHVHAYETIMILYNITSDFIGECLKEDYAGNSFSAAQCLVRHKIGQLIDIDQTENVVLLIKKTKESMSNIMGGCGGCNFKEDTVKKALDPISTVHHLLLIEGGNTYSCEDIFMKVKEVSCVLLDLLESLSNDLISTLRVMVTEEVEVLKELFETPSKFLYYIDDYEKMLALVDNPLILNDDCVSFEQWFPCVHMSIKSACALDFAAQLTLLLGLNSEKLPQSWINQCIVGVGEFDAKSNVIEAETLQGIIEGIEGDQVPEILVKRVHGMDEFINHKNPDKVFSKLKPVKSPDCLLLWVSESSLSEIMLRTESDVVAMLQERRGSLVRSNSKVVARQDCSSKSDSSEIECLKNVAVQTLAQEKTYVESDPRIMIVPKPFILTARQNSSCIPSPKLRSHLVGGTPPSGRNSPLVCKNTFNLQKILPKQIEYSNTAFVRSRGKSTSPLCSDFSDQEEVVMRKATPVTRFSQLEKLMAKSTPRFSPASSSSKVLVKQQKSSIRKHCARRNSNSPSRRRNIAVKPVDSWKDRIMNASPSTRISKIASVDTKKKKSSPHRRILGPHNFHSSPRRDMMNRDKRSFSPMMTKMYKKNSISRLM
uniref:Uncharacterized protein n=1 Tax=Corethron hystrix TaxID=216773 RepID=A0A7S1BQ71_9STRA|mmetsp:Transcript_36871/g.86117  ORF Transcript_36871/g.86117 Transcript_36871/m.86117 type:complete len:730 (+) Transcript_36871:52-2241(+)